MDAPVYQKKLIYTNERLTINCTTVIFSGLNTNTLSFHYIHSFEDGIKYHHLTIAFSHLSFAVIHVGSSKAINFAVVDTGGVSASSMDFFNWIGWWVCNISPFWKLGVIDWWGWYCQLGYFLICIVVLTTNQIGSLITKTQSWIFSRSWHPILMGKFCKLSIERLSFLHPLHEKLQTSGQFLS